MTELQEPQMRRHAFDPLSFLAGTVFVLAAVTTLWAPALPQLRPALWGPTLLILAGVLMLATMWRSRVTEDEGGHRYEDEDVDDPPRS